MSVGLAGLGLGFVGSIFQGIAGRNTAKYNADVAKNNAKARQQQGDYEADLQRRENERSIGRQQVQGAKSGATLSGSLLDSLANSAGEGQQEVDAINYGTTLDVNAHNQQAKQFKNEAKSSIFSSVLSGATTLFTGIQQQKPNKPNPNSALAPNLYAKSWLGNSWTPKKIGH